jgi:hypothetical protein
MVWRFKEKENQSKEPDPNPGKMKERVRNFRHSIGQNFARKKTAQNW